MTITMLRSLHNSTGNCLGRYTQGLKVYKDFGSRILGCCLGFRVQVWDPWSFFKLLDSDGGGFVEIEDAGSFKGFLRMVL